MKLLLTSSGITNDSIAHALEQLANKPFTEISIAFIPTAALIHGTDKRWLVGDFNNCLKYNPKAFNIVDFSSVPKADWQPRLEQADILAFNGGNLFYLMNRIQQTNFLPFLKELLKTKVYMGISASTILATKDATFSSKEKKKYAESVDIECNNQTLHFVDFYIRPHFNNPDFPHASESNIQKIAKTLREPVYTIDDNSALAVNEDKISVISEGSWKKFN